ncbi:MAG: hypothetical protein ABII08_01150, partial [Candidatus Beckwithbacteria bacterium]
IIYGTAIDATAFIDRLKVSYQARLNGNLKEFNQADYNQLVVRKYLIEPLDHWNEEVKEIVSKIHREMEANTEVIIAGVRGESVSKARGELKVLVRFVKKQKQSEGSSHMINRALDHYLDRLETIEKMIDQSENTVNQNQIEYLGMSFGLGNFEQIAKIWRDAEEKAREEGREGVARRWGWLAGVAERVGGGSVKDVSNIGESTQSREVMEKVVVANKFPDIVRNKPLETTDLVYSVPVGKEWNNGMVLRLIKAMLSQRQGDGSSFELQLVVNSGQEYIESQQIIEFVNKVVEAQKLGREYDKWSSKWYSWAVKRRITRIEEQLSELAGERNSYLEQEIIKLAFEKVKQVDVTLIDATKTDFSETIYGSGGIDGFRTLGVDVAYATYAETRPDLVVSLYDADTVPQDNRSTQRLQALYKSEPEMDYHFSPLNYIPVTDSAKHIADSAAVTIGSASSYNLDSGHGSPQITFRLKNYESIQEITDFSDLGFQGGEDRDTAYRLIYWFGKTEVNDLFNKLGVFPPVQLVADRLDGFVDASGRRDELKLREALLPSVAAANLFSKLSWIKPVLDDLEGFEKERINSVLTRARLFYDKKQRLQQRFYRLVISNFVDAYDNGLIAYDGEKVLIDEAEISQMFAGQALLQYLNFNQGLIKEITDEDIEVMKYFVGKREDLPESVTELTGFQLAIREYVGEMISVNQKFYSVGDQEIPAGAMVVGEKYKRQVAEGVEWDDWRVTDLRSVDDKRSLYHSLSTELLTLTYAYSKYIEVRQFDESRQGDSVNFGWPDNPEEQELMMSYPKLDKRVAWIKVNSEGRGDQWLAGKGEMIIKGDYDEEQEIGGDKFTIVLPKKGEKIEVNIHRGVGKTARELVDLVAEELLWRDIKQAEGIIVFDWWGYNWDIEQREHKKIDISFEYKLGEVIEKDLPLAEKVDDERTIEYLGMSFGLGNFVREWWERVRGLWAGVTERLGAGTVEVASIDQHVLSEEIYQAIKKKESAQVILDMFEQNIKTAKSLNNHIHVSEDPLFDLVSLDVIGEYLVNQSTFDSRVEEGIPLDENFQRLIMLVELYKEKYQEISGQQITTDTIDYILAPAIKEILIKQASLDLLKPGNFLASGVYTSDLDKIIRAGGLASQVTRVAMGELDQGSPERYFGDNILRMIDTHGIYFYHWKAQKNTPGAYSQPIAELGSKGVTDMAIIYPTESIINHADYLVQRGSDVESEFVASNSLIWIDGLQRGEDGLILPLIEAYLVIPERKQADIQQTFADQGYSQDWINDHIFIYSDEDAVRTMANEFAGSNRLMKLLHDRIDQWLHQVYKPNSVSFDMRRMSRGIELDNSADLHVWEKTNIDKSRINENNGDGIEDRTLAEKVDEWIDPDTDCSGGISLGCLVKAAYAAGGGKVCPWWEKGAVVIVATIAGTVGKVTIFLVEVEGWARLFWSLMPFFKHTRLPKPEDYSLNVFGLTCSNGKCEDGCSTGYRCNNEIGCCKGIEDYADTICSSDGLAEIDRYMYTYYDDYHFFQLAAGPDVETIRFCADRCESGQCVGGYREEFDDIEPCSDHNLSNAWSYNLQNESYTPARVCQKDDGNLMYVLGIPYSFKDDYSCSEEGSSLVYKSTGETIKTCPENSICTTLTFRPDCYLKSTLEAWNVCAPGIITLPNGFHCTVDGPKCNPGEFLPQTINNPCTRICQEDGQTTETVYPLSCLPEVFDYEDLVCQDNPKTGNQAVYKVDLSSRMGGEGDVISDCGSMSCSKGQCAVETGSSCGQEGQLMMRSDGDCYVECSRGSWQDTGACGHINVVSYNNIGQRKVYEALSLLPDYLFNDSALTFYYNYTWDSGISPLAAGFAMTPYVISVGNLNGWQNYASKVIIHEFFHNWMQLQAYSEVMRLAQYSKAVGSASTLLNLINLNKAVPREYLDLTGCHPIGGGGYNYSLPNVTDYHHDGEIKDVPCYEDFVDSAAWYVVNPWELKENSLERYEYFRDNVFTDPVTGEVYEYLESDKEEVEVKQIEIGEERVWTEVDFGELVEAELVR